LSDSCNEIAPQLGMHSRELMQKLRWDRGVITYTPSLVAEQSAEADTISQDEQPNWRVEMLKKYLNHEPLPRKDAWWLDVSSGLVVREILDEKSGIPIPKDAIKFWREEMYPKLYEEYTIQLLETADQPATP
ncbi:MAG: hypothetical protein AAB358_01440, partial [Patescibacteria group bacterium]